MEIVINQVEKNKVAGYLSVPKPVQQGGTSSGNALQAVVNAHSARPLIRRVSQSRPRLRLSSSSQR